MSVPNPSDADIARLLGEAKVFAVIGASNKPERPSFGVMDRLIARGTTVIPVNPGLAGQEILGQRVFATLTDVPGPVDIVDIFRTSEAALGVTRDAIAQKDRLGLRAVWMQIGVINEEAACLAREAGLTVIMDRCPKIEIARLLPG